MNPETFNVMLKFFEKVMENEEEYDCKICGEPFIGIEELNTHSITKHLEQRYVCDFCYKDYKMESSMLYHINELHMKLDLRYLEKQKVQKNKKRKKADEDDWSPPESSANETEDSDYDQYDDEGKRMKPCRVYPRKCDHCDYEVPTGKVHYHHYLHHHQDIIDQYPYGGGGKAKMPCSYCGVLIRVGYHLTQHEAKHSGIKVKCTICDKQYDSTKLMQMHKRAVHIERNLICDYCKKGYKTKLEITRHIRTHTGEKPFKCHICDAAFAHSGNRQIHVRSTHQNIKQVPKKKQVINKQKDKISKVKKNKNSKKKEVKKQRGRPRRAKKVKTDSDSDGEVLSVIKAKIK